VKLLVLIHFQYLVKKRVARDHEVRQKVKLRVQLRENGPRRFSIFKYIESNGLECVERLLYNTKVVFYIICKQYINCRAQ
jgi:hypothetical protein